VVHVIPAFLFLAFMAVDLADINIQFNPEKFQA
jgi:hypothetical protein